MDISLSIPLEEAEIIIMNGISQGAVMHYADIMLDYLNAKGIRTGVTGLTADKVWYCGDRMEDDIYGANSVGMLPVLYEGRTKNETHFLPDQNDRDNPDFEYLCIHDWRELMDILAG